MWCTRFTSIIICCCCCRIESICDFCCATKWNRASSNFIFSFYLCAAHGNTDFFFRREREGDTTIIWLWKQNQGIFKTKNIANISTELNRIEPKWTEQNRAKLKRIHTQNDRRYEHFHWDIFRSSLLLVLLKQRSIIVSKALSCWDCLYPNKRYNGFTSVNPLWNCLTKA